MKPFISLIIAVFLFTSINAQTITLNIAISQGDVNKVRTLLEKGYSIHKDDRQGNIPINVATYKANMEILQMLVNYGANVNQTDNKGNFPLLLASIKNKIELVRYLLEQGAIIDSQTNSGRTALITTAMANKNNSLEMIKLFINNGADINMIDDYNRTVLDYAKTQEVIDYLKMNGALYGSEL